MKFFRINYKLFLLLSLLAAGVIKVSFYSCGSDKKAVDKKIKNYRKQWLSNVNKVLGLQIEVNGEVHSNQASALWVANHISWMDISVVGSQGVGFLSKAEVRKWPLVGWLGEKSGTVFIERGGKNASQNAAKAIAEKILEGDSILVFPEATTGTGENVKRFHARIFAPALDHQLRVQPVAVQYLDEEGKAHPEAIWVNESFFKNLMGVLSQVRIQVVIHFLPVIDPQHHSERKQIAELAENNIRNIVESNNKENHANR